MADGSETAAPAAAAVAAPAVEAPAAAAPAVAATGAESTPAAATGGETTGGAGTDTVAASQTGNDTVAAARAPDSYADFAVPEGVALNDTLLGEFKSAAKELDLDQASAQRVLDLGVKLVQSTQQTNADQLTSIKDGWAAQAAADPDIGGAKLPANNAEALRALTQFGTPALRDMLNGSGLMNHPEVIRVFAKVGRAIGNETTVTGDHGSAPALRGSGGDADAARKLYPNQS